MTTGPIVNRSLANTFVIWSIEHDAWWRAGWLGYTLELCEAGLYTREEADAVLARANAGPRINECAIPVARLFTSADEEP